MVVIAGLVLAAGPSTRMGRPKMLLPFGGRTVLAAAVAPLLEAGLDRVVVVLGHEAEAVRRGAALPADPRLEVVVNDAWSEGMSRSLRRGLEDDACGGAQAVLVALGDQPCASVDLIRRVVEAGCSGACLVVPVLGGRAGHPVLFGRALFVELAALSGDVGGREVVRRHWPEAVQVLGEPLLDLDTDEDYRALLEGRAAPLSEGLELPRPGDLELPLPGGLAPPHPDDATRPRRS